MILTKTSIPMLWGFIAFLILFDHQVRCSIIGASFCRVCDSADPNAQDDCRQTSYKQHVVCRQNCLSRYTITSSGLRIQKSCAEDSVCLSEWWSASRENPQCARDKLTSEMTSCESSLTCSVCCRADLTISPYCNSDFYPSESTLVQYSGSTYLNSTDKDTEDKSKDEKDQPADISSDKDLNNSKDPNRSMTASICRVCDSHDPGVGDDCKQTSNKRHVVCKENCFSRYSITESGLRIQKSCANNSVCISDWWFSSRKNPQCTLEVVADANAGVNRSYSRSCSVCCRATSTSDPYCNDRFFPLDSSLVLYPNVARTGSQDGGLENENRTAQSQHSNSSSSDEDGGNTRNNSSSVPDGGLENENRTAQSQHCNSSSSDEDGSSTRNNSSSVPDGELENENTTAPFQQNNASNPDDDRKSTKSNTSSGPVYLESSRCSFCPQSDGNNSACQEATTCSSRTPFCMTSFYDDGFDPMEVKRCASAFECQTLWWQFTRLDSDCMADGENGPYTWPLGKSGECHFCCQTPEGESRDWCNRDPWPIKPRHLLHMSEPVAAVRAQALNVTNVELGDEIPTPGVTVGVVMPTNVTITENLTFGHRKCFQCGDVSSGKPCVMESVSRDSSSCPMGLDFCMNDVYHDRRDGSAAIYKRLMRI